MVVGLSGVLLLSAFGVAVLVDALSGQPETVVSEDPVPYASRPELPDVPGKTAIRSRGETWTVENHLEVIIWIVVVFLALALVVWIIYGKLT